MAGPRRRCLLAVDRDSKRTLKCRNCRRLTEDRDVWRRRIEEVKAKVGLQGH